MSQSLKVLPHRGKLITTAKDCTVSDTCIYIYIDDVYIVMMYMYNVLEHVYNMYTRNVNSLQTK